MSHKGNIFTVKDKASPFLGDSSLVVSIIGAEGYSNYMAGSHTLTPIQDKEKKKDTSTTAFVTL